MRQLCHPLLLASLSLSALGLFACSEAAPKKTDDRVTIISDDGDLASGVTDKNEPVDVQPQSIPNALAVPGSSGYDLTLVAEVKPPEVDGEILQATSVAFQDGVAIVSYNVAGFIQKGAVDVFVFDADKHPVLTSRATFSDTDVNAAGLWKGRVYLATATADETFGTPAVIEALTVDGGKLSMEGHFRTGLASFAVTGVGFGEDRVYATTGNTGGVFGLDPVSGEVFAKTSFDDARWLACPGNGTVVAVRGTPGEVGVFASKDLSGVSSFGFDGANVPESKSTVEVLGGNAFVAGGPGGTFVIDLASGKTIANIPVPKVQGELESEVVTNAVSVDGDLVFVSNGSAGVFLVAASRDLTEPGDPEGPALEFEVIGRLAFSGDGGGSVNHIVYRDGFLFVATGRAGLKIVRVDARACEPVAEIPDNGADDNCDGTIDEVVDVIGCSDGGREGFVDVGAWPDVAACSGAWTLGGVLSDSLEPTCGRLAGNNGKIPDGKECGVADLCSEGWHVCDGALDLGASSPTGCSGADPVGQQFFVTRQSGTGCGVCATGDDTTSTACSSPTSCQRGCAQTDKLGNDVFGCGTIGSTSLSDCGPLNRFTSDGCSALPAPWTCRAGFAEAATIKKATSAAGGVLCCRDR